MLVKEHRVSPATSAKPNPSRSQIRALAERIARRWGLVFTRDMQPPEILAVERFVVVPYDGIRMFPVFQFGPDGRPTDEFVTVLAHLRNAGWDDVAIATWFASANESLGNEAPADAVKCPDTVVRAVRRLHTR